MFYSLTEMRGAAMSLTAAASGLVVFLLSVSVVQGQDVWGVTYSSTEICAVKGSTVEINCSYTYPSTVRGGVNTVEKTFWFTKQKGGEPVDLRTDSEYAGRVETLCGNNTCTLRIRNLRERDSAQYRFRIKTNQDAYAGDPVTLSVPDPGIQVKVSKTSSCYGDCIQADLECVRGCLPTSRRSYIWYKDGQKIAKDAKSFNDYFYPKESYACAVKGYENVPSPSVCVNGGVCNTVTYSERSICAFKGSSVDISCTYSSYEDHVKSKFWFRPERSHQDLSEDSQYRERVQVLSPRRESTLRISDLRDSDSAQYLFTFKTASSEWGRDLPGTTLTVTALQVQVIRAKVYTYSTEAELKCHSSCSPAGSLYYVWFKNGETIMTTGISSYEGLFHPRDNISCALKGHEDFPSPAVYAPKLPSVSVSPSAEIEEGSSVTLTCSSDANPAANYTWYKKSPNAHFSHVNEGPILVLSSINSSDSVQHYCTAENKLGKTSRDISIDVKYAPKLPSVSVSPSAEIEEGSSVTLTCSSDANPAANYTWYKEDEDSPKASGQIFTITDFRAEHSGNYSCEAQNKLGRSNSTLYLTVGTASWKLPAVVTIPVVLLAVISLSVFLWISRRKSASRDSSEPAERADNREEPLPDQPEEQGDLQYATVHFSNSRAEPLYSNMRADQPLRHTEQQEVPEYAAVKFKSAAPRPRGQDSAEDPAALYSTVNKSH
ncbi:titin-like isoform X1 [Eleginops maclovinus]|uniref:titin-like isoform X1 n=2 Tax=Eleginops maclovinus TaxID=56733 RepID=UPI00307FF921